MSNFYDVSVGTYNQVLGGVQGVLNKARAHFEEQGTDLEEIVQTQLYDDMLPFWFQIASVAHHSKGGLTALETGQFSPPTRPENPTWDSLTALVEEAKAVVDAADVEAINASAEGEVVFSRGDFSMAFKASDFILTFSLPNFYFHATTTYDMLRMKGVPLGKMDFLGRMRIKG
ncbi:MAG: DUF1993 domain-containing protein [Pseudomonadota bacterium]